MINTEVEKIGWLFVQEYYTFLNTEPEKLHCFYQNKSTLIHGVEGETLEPLLGQLEINAKITQMKFKGSSVYISNVDSLPSLDGCIIVQVLGELSNNNKPSLKFAQTFFLAKQPNGFYVLNDIFRFLKDDVDIHYEEVPDLITKETFIPPPAKKIEQPAVPQKTVDHVIQKREKSERQEPIEKSQEFVESKQEKIEKPSSPKKEVVKPFAEKITSPVKNISNNSAPVLSPSKTIAQPTQSLQSQENPVSSSNASVPKTWANLAASNPDKFANQLSPAQGQVLNTNSVQNFSKTPKSAEKFVINENRNYQPSTTESENRTAPQINGNHKPHGEEREKFSIYLKNIPQDVTVQELTQAFSPCGDIRHVDIITEKNIAFVEFQSQDSLKKAIGFNVTIRATALVGEERKKNKYTKKNDNKKRNSRDKPSRNQNN